MLTFETDAISRPIPKGLK